MKLQASLDSFHSDSPLSLAVKKTIVNLKILMKKIIHDKSYNHFPGGRRWTESFHTWPLTFIKTLGSLGCTLCTEERPWGHLCEWPPSLVLSSNQMDVCHRPQYLQWGSIVCQPFISPWTSCLETEPRLRVQMDHRTGYQSGEWKSRYTSACIEGIKHCPYVRWDRTQLSITGQKTLDTRRNTSKEWNTHTHMYVYFIYIYIKYIHMYM